ncbi:MAG TPA: cyclopropane-fatty-acyl-phospholipid synthase, partial [Candidatus Kaiserbacteria bacterium]|nr:cyclopropane-fatty-acyl-phospholipid synthase [Candidatus Kaiserbacteria bacterium]
DYRNLPKEYGKIFDRVVSLGMFEHVGISNYDTYFSTVRSVLKDDGLFLLHTIGTNDRFTGPDPWIHKYIFPNGVIPALRQVTRAAQGKFILEDWHNFGADYDKTLMAWYHNIENAWDTLPSYDEKFRRMWRYYLLMCAGAFRARKLQLWQIVFSNGEEGGYRSVREIKEGVAMSHI